MKILNETESFWIKSLDLFFFAKRTVTGETYLDMLEHFVLPTIGHPTAPKPALPALVVGTQ